MGTEKEKKKVVKVEHQDVQRVIVPDGLSYRSAGKYCEAKADEDETVIPVYHDYRTLVWQGAYSLEQVLMRYYSATAEGATEISVPSANGDVLIRWGKWKVAGLGYVEQSVAVDGQGPIYRIEIRCQRMNRDKANALGELVKTDIAKRTLYRGSAIILKPDCDGELDPFAPPEVVKLESLGINDLILPHAVEEAVKSELLTPIIDETELKARGVPLQRGALLAGRPGTGKTLTAKILAKVAVENNFTVWYLPDARAIEAALRIALSFEPALLISEDLDRQLGGKRGAMTDRILNALSGLDSTARIIFLATTNDKAALPSALLRSGRLDTVLDFGPVDEDAAERLLRMFLGERAPEDFNGSAAKCVGLLPAFVREVANRAQLHAIRNKSGGLIDPEEITLAASSVWDQQKMLEAAEKREAEVQPDSRTEVLHKNLQPVRTEGSAPSSN